MPTVKATVDSVAWLFASLRAYRADGGVLDLGDLVPDGGDTVKPPPGAWLFAYDGTPNTITLSAEKFEAYVTGVASFGVFVTLQDYFVEGLVPIQALGNDFFVY